MAKHRRLLALIAAVLSSGGGSAAAASNNGRHRTRQQKIHQRDANKIRKYGSTRRRLKEEESPPVVDMIGHMTPLARPVARQAVEEN